MVVGVIEGKKKESGSKSNGRKQNEVAVKVIWEKREVAVRVVVGWLKVEINGISTFVCYLMPNPFLY